MSTSHFMMELKAVSSMPAASMPTMDGVNSTSGQRKRSLPMVITCAANKCSHRSVKCFAHPLVCWAEHSMTILL